MKDKTMFVVWLVISAITVAGLVIMWRVNLVQEIWSKDSSCLSGVILAFFVVSSLFLGKTAWNATEHGISECEESIGWFSGEVCMSLGMLGTIIGLVMMLSGFESINVSSRESTQSLLTSLGGGLGTALYTTMVGLACAINLKVQTFTLGLFGSGKEKNE